MNVKDGAGSYQSPPLAANPGDTISIQLASQAGVSSWTIACVYTDELSSASSVTSSLVIDNVNKVATFTAPVAGRAYIFQSQINGGLNLATKLPDPTTSTTFKIYTPVNSNQVVAVNETLEADPVFGWSKIINPLIRSPFSAGTGTQPIGAQEYDTNVDTKGTARYVEPKHVQTTNATVTTIDSFTLGSNTAVGITSLITGIKSDSTAAGSWIMNAAFRNNAGTVAQVGSTYVTAIGADDGTWVGPSATFSGTSVLLQVAGKAATTIQWSIVHTRLEVIP